MSKKNVEIQKVVVRIGDKEIELSLDEAKELRSILNDTFGEKMTPIVIDRPYPVYPPMYPYRYWTVTIGDDPSCKGGYHNRRLEHHHPLRHAVSLEQQLMTQSVQPRFRSLPLTAWQLDTRPLWERRAISALTIGAKQRASGGDGSHWNLPGILNPDLDTQGLLDLWFNKLTEGIGFLDESYKLNWPGMRKLPVKGPYHYQLSRYSGAAQMSWFLQCLDPYHKNINVMALDFESVGNTFTTAFMVELHLSFEWLKSRTDARLELYTNRSLRNWLHYESIRYYGVDVFLDPEIGLWLASPLLIPSPDMTPVMPDGVTEWDFLQWTWALNGNPFIADSTIDFNVYNGDRAQLLADFGVGTPPPPPPPPGDDMDKIVIQMQKDTITAARVEIDRLSARIAEETEAILTAEKAIQAEIDGAPSPPPVEYLYVNPATAANGLRTRAGTTLTAPVLDIMPANFIVRVLSRQTVAGAVWVWHDGGGTRPAGYSVEKSQAGTLYLLPKA